MVFFNDFWNMLRDYQPINETVKLVVILFKFKNLMY